LAFMQAFHGRPRKIWLVPVQTGRAMPMGEIKTRLAALPNIEEAPSVTGALSAAKAWAKAEDGIVLIAGSLYLAGEVLAAN
jgi:folylpolyglutamate synthase/dihydropteroate synthase